MFKIGKVKRDKATLFQVSIVFCNQPQVYLAAGKIFGCENIFLPQ